jgi:hypothetical protein
MEKAVVVILTVQATMHEGYWRVEVSDQDGLKFVTWCQDYYYNAAIVKKSKQLWKGHSEFVLGLVILNVQRMTEEETCSRGFASWKREDDDVASFFTNLDDAFRK